ncbi:uncharacterized protein KY384_000074 [Bacidia gigantensis]|uniref:uncharacterized protein n=1 Tax=Bacidia gigantensis TaxID=2732470 RepID=UPI001D051BF2|nr:uncharacterized protein KY384_000074 [Bacidia gigantensis]KAG8526082.1 hypothetical protein KY384_000074 [Bacidia gigantensis]
MSLSQWQNYCYRRDVFYKEIEPYYEVCQKTVNARRLRQMPRATQQAWGQTAGLLRKWQDAYLDWIYLRDGMGSEFYRVQRTAYAECERALSEVLVGYTRAQTKRRTNLHRLRRALQSIQRDLSNYKIEREDEHKVIANMKEADRRLWKFALRKSPNTMRAITDFVRYNYYE